MVEKLQARILIPQRIHYLRFDGAHSIYGGSNFSALVDQEVQKLEWTFRCHCIPPGDTLNMRMRRTGSRFPREYNNGVVLYYLHADDGSSHMLPVMGAIMRRPQYPNCDFEEARSFCPPRKQKQGGNNSLWLSVILLSYKNMRL
ncbi:hypothetical protein AVEN_225254-1 [Araneus ventricosus]|uniref:Uncharacterized protein n=1 Tax=Araneus ventricosus TaxID=182803 RepID=A0A4Y2AL76_ARAVE|nr:hypothetical protein AVEN_225254-1 [Araneus ventricosus]